MNLLEKGEDFADLAEKLSEDRSTAVKGGVLQNLVLERWSAEFEKVAFSLDNAGDISQPFLTDYGWHVVKLIEKNIPSFQL